MAVPAQTHLEPVPNEPDATQQADQEQQGAPDPVDAARGEVVQGEPNRTVNWHGLELTLPAELPAWVMFDQIDNEIEGDPSNSFNIRVARDLLGVEQWRQAREWTVQKGLGFDSFVELVSNVYEVYGVGPGEAEASPSSSEPAGS